MSDTVTAAIIIGIYGWLWLVAGGLLVWWYNKRRPK